MSSEKTPICIVLNKNTGMTHYSMCDHEGKIVGERTFCGKPIHDRYVVTTTDMYNTARSNMRNLAKCMVCDMKERGMRGSKEHWLYMPKEKDDQ